MNKGYLEFGFKFIEEELLKQQPSLIGTDLSIMCAEVDNMHGIIKVKFTTSLPVGRLSSEVADDSCDVNRVVLHSKSNDKQL